MKTSRRISILIVVLVVLSVIVFQAIGVSAQAVPVGTGGLIGLGTLAQIVRLMVGAAFVYSFSKSS